ncbi:hypothetical protein BKA65DRAFT_148873 [Rhexocercosporidium sp. MPI-PUGE-AT-0058]|nr:hypothetical protein BKA65DRAFT_148873 [Rhexocercosporidium sp. MPI-PUGE-AT-0058]
MISPSLQPASSASAVHERQQPADGFDSRFAAVDKPSRFFNVGRVFKTLWVEPAGTTSRDTSHPAYNTVGYGQFSHAKVRMFVVIRKRRHSCLCLAIHSYGGQGTAKQNVRSQDHAVVHSFGDPEPRPLPDEYITIRGFAVKLEEPGETISPMSRLDFGKIYTVEHNLKILRVGRILPGQLPALEEAFIDALIPTVAYDESEPESEPEPKYPREHRWPAFINWCDNSVNGAELRTEGHSVHDRDFYQPGKVFLVVRTENQIKPVRFLLVVLEQNSNDCKCILIQKGPIASFAKASPVFFGNWLGRSLVSYGGIHVNVRDPEFLQNAAGSCISYTKVYTVHYNVDCRAIGYVDPKSMSGLMEEFEHVHHDRLHKNKPHQMAALSAGSVASQWSGGLGSLPTVPNAPQSIISGPTIASSSMSLTSYSHQVQFPPGTAAAATTHSSADIIPPFQSSQIPVPFQQHSGDPPVTVLDDPSWFYTNSHIAPMMDLSSPPLHQFGALTPTPSPSTSMVVTNPRVDQMATWLQEPAHGANPYEYLYAAADPSVSQARYKSTKDDIQHVDDELAARFRRL